MVKEHTVTYVTEPEPLPQRSRIGFIAIFQISQFRNLDSSDIQLKNRGTERYGLKRETSNTKTGNAGAGPKAEKI